MTLMSDKAPKMWLVRLSLQHMGALWEKNTKMYLKYIYFVLSILQIHLHIYVHNKNYPAIVHLLY